MPRRVDYAGRRDELCDAVVRIAGDDGFRAVTIRRVAAAANASTSVVTHYFASRDDLVRSTVRRAVEQRRAALVPVLQGLEPAEGLRALAEWSILRTDERLQRCWLAIVLGARTDAVLRDELDAFNRWWAGVLRDLTERLDPPHPDPPRFADLFDVVVDGMVLAGFDGGEGWSNDRRSRTLGALLDSIGLASHATDDRGARWRVDDARVPRPGHASRR